MFEAVKLTENANTGISKYSGYSKGFDTGGSFLLSDGKGFGKNVIFGIDMGLLMHIDYTNLSILILGKRPKRWFRLYCTEKEWNREGVFYKFYWAADKVFSYNFAL